MNKDTVVKNKALDSAITIPPADRKLIDEIINTFFWEMANLTACKSEIQQVFKGRGVEAFPYICLKVKDVDYVFLTTYQKIINKSLQIRAGAEFTVGNIFDDSKRPVWRK
jgi:hypothetical protein